MRFPTFQEVPRYRDMTTVFGGYNHQISCDEGQFFDMKNMTSKYFPVLSPRQNRGIIKRLSKPQGIICKDAVWWIDDNILYKNGVAVLDKKYSEAGVLPLEGDAQRTLVKMGAYIIIMPDKLWVKEKNDSDTPEWGYIDNKVAAINVALSACEASGTVIAWQNAEYYKTTEAQDGDYMMSVNANGQPSLKVYSGATSIWMNVSSTYTQISAKGIGKGFEKDDGIKISATLDEQTQIDALSNILINHDGNGRYYTNTYIIDKTDDSITVPGIYKPVVTEDGYTPYVGATLLIERKMPEMAFITECNNRLWGCSKDGHELYCCKLGDVTNWNCFRGNATDSWAATVGSDGKFTGAITYYGYPIFFKEDCLIKIAVSATGGHQTKETRCRGVQKGSEKSLSILNEILYYKSPGCVCGYNGSLPYNISDELGDVAYYDAVAGSMGDRYYISMRDAKNEYSMFVYDAKNGIWCKEDDTSVLGFCSYMDDMYYIDAHDRTIKTIKGTLCFAEGEDVVDAIPTKEADVDWHVESGPIGYSSPDNKYVGRINIRITLECGTDVDLYLQYDSCGEWEHKFNMSGKGTRTFSIPIIPKRCDHFAYKISGRGDCKIHSVTKTIEEGSEG